MKKHFLFACALFFSCIVLQAQTLAFPTAEGYGKYATGGRGGAVVEVTNLLDDPNNPPEGSLRWALKQHSGEPLTIVFRVSGIIDLKGNDLRSKRNNITIAGQTAPGDGICIKGGTINLGGSRNLIIRHIRSRVGVLNDNSFCPGTVDDANFIKGSSFNIENGGNWIVDHCSFGWSAEENVNLYDNDNTTVQWCIFHEGLYNAGHSKGNRSYGAVLGGKTATYHHNLLAHNYNRSPRFGATTKNDVVMLLDFVNNVNYNYGKKNACYGGDNRQGDAGLFQLNFVNNYYKPGPAYPGDRTAVFIGASYCNPDQGSQGKSYGSWHLSGNYMEGTYAASKGLNDDNYKGFDIDAYTEAVPGLTLADMKSDHLDIAYPVNTESAHDAYNSVLARAGAFPRDAVDARIIEEVKNGTASGYGSFNAGRVCGIIDKPSDAGGYPEYKIYNNVTDNDHDGMDDAWETAHGFDPTNAADRNVIVGGGYTALEAYLCSLVGETIELTSQRPFDMVVAQDGSGDYTTIQAAIDAVPDNGKRTIIFVRNGLYNEKVFIGTRYTTSQKIISIIGESKEGVIISWDDYHGKKIDYPGKGSITADGMTAPTMTVTSPDFYMENVTVRNTVTDATAQAEALYQAGDRQILKNVALEGYQDTHRTKKTNRFFYFDCDIKGNVDFIYGGGTCYFYQCNIVGRGRAGGKSGGYITAPEDITAKGVLPSGKPIYYEFFFNDCDIISDGNSDFYLARPWADKDCGTVFLNTRMCPQVNKAGWSGSGNASNMSFAEYNTLNTDGTSYDLSKRVNWGIQLTEDDYYRLGINDIYTVVNASETFDPIPSVVGVAPSSSTSLTKSGDVIRWEAVPGARGYIIYLDGEIMDYAEGNVYFDTKGRNGKFQVRAIAPNGALSPLNGSSFNLNETAMRQALNPVQEVVVEKKNCLITASVSPIEAGTVSPSRIECKEGDKVTLKVTANDGYIFNHWVSDETGVVMSSAAVYTFVATDNLAITANFSKSEIGGPVDESYLSATWDGSNVVRAQEFAAVVDPENSNATNVVEGRSVVEIHTAQMTVAAVSGATPAANPSDVFDGKGEQIDAEGNVAAWNPVQWKTGKQTDIEWYYLEGTGNPYVAIAGEHFSSDYPDAYRAKYTYYQPDGSTGMPTTGVYYKFTPKTDGTLRVKVWVKKDRRRTFVVDDSDALPIAYKVEGYINGQNGSDGKKCYLSDDEIRSLHDSSLGSGVEPWVIGTGSGHFWGWLVFDVRQGHSYWAFMQNAQLGFAGYDFIGSSSAIDVIERESIELSHGLYDLQGRRYDFDSTLPAGLYLHNGKKILIK